jgi:hypothetical protein
MSDKLIKVINKFREGIYQLNNNDKLLLKNVIVSSGDIDDLSNSIYIYSYSFEIDKDVVDICRNFIIKNMTPGLSSICFKAVVRYWCIYECDIINSMKSYLIVDLWDEFYDEILFIVHFLNSDDGVSYRYKFDDELNNLLMWSIENNIDEITELYKAN